MTTMSENFRPYMTFSFIVSAPETLHPTGMLTAFFVFVLYLFAFLHVFVLFDQFYESNTLLLFFFLRYAKDI